MSDTSSAANIVHLTHDKAAGTLYIALQDEYEGPVLTQPVKDNLNFDIGADGRIVGIQILNADTVNFSEMVS